MHESKDYEINLLVEMWKYYDHSNSSDSGRLRDYYARSIARYMTRLLFAIGWDKLRKFADEKVNSYLYGQLFPNPSTPEGNHGKEPNAYCTILENLGKDCGYPELIQGEVDILRKLGVGRNVDAHDPNNVDNTNVNLAVEEGISGFSKLFSGRYTGYIIPKSRSDDGSLLICDRLACGDSFVKECMVPSEAIRWNPRGSRLFYDVTDDRGEHVYYNLSPFIAPPEYLSIKEPHFRTYYCVQDSGFGSDCDSLCYSDVAPRTFNLTEDGQQRPEFCDTVLEYRRADLFDREIVQSLTWTSLGSGQKRVHINFSSYPGFGDVVRNQYCYCGEICPIRKDVIEFCKDENKQLATVTGNGGVGKTALMLSVLAEILMDRTTYKYTNLIFVSAKKQYYDSASISRQQMTNEADIHSFSELIQKLAELMDVVRTDDQTTEALAKILINSIGESNKKRFLLIVDDLDSLASEDQYRILGFIHGFDPHKFKTLVTTRDIAASSPISFQLTELNSRQSLTYAKWYVEKYLSVTQWERWDRREEAELSIADFGEGNPLTIQMLMKLVSQGVAHTFNTPATQTEKDAYLYNTIQNILTPDEKYVLEICRRLYLALPKDYRDAEMQKLIPRFLAVWCEIGEERFDAAFAKLCTRKLLQERIDVLFKPYSQKIIGNSIFENHEVILPTMFDLVSNDVNHNPVQWLTLGDVMRLLTDFIVRSENLEGYDNLLARKLMESILKPGKMTQDLEEKVRRWLAQHSIVDPAPNSNEAGMRMLQKIRTDWEDIKQQCMEGADDVSREMQALGIDIRRLKRELESHPDPGIEKRLAAIIAETTEYGW